MKAMTFRSQIILAACVISKLFLDPKSIVLIEDCSIKMEMSAIRKTDLVEPFWRLLKLCCPFLLDFLFSCPLRLYAAPAYVPQSVIICFSGNNMIWIELELLSHNTPHIPQVIPMLMNGGDGNSSVYNKDKSRTVSMSTQIFINARSRTSATCLAPCRDLTQNRRQTV